MATNASELQAYFADLDAKEEAEAKALGMDPNMLRLYRERPDFVNENRRASRVALQEAETTGESAKDILFNPTRMETLFGRGETALPPSMMRPKELANAVPRAAEGLERKGRQLREPTDMPETVPSLTMPSVVPAKTSDFASLQKTVSPGSLASPIPIASAPVKTDVPAAVAGTIAPTTSTSSAPSAGTSSTVKPPPVDAGSGGDDEMASLRRRLGLLQAFEGVGSAASGKNLRTDGGILADRMKQIEALRAKREERSMELARGKAEAAAASKVTGEMLQSLGITPPSSLAELPSAEAVLKAGKFPAEVAGIQALTAQRAAGADVAKARLPLLGGQVALTDARTQNLLNKDLRDERAMQLREEAQDSMNELRKAQAESARAAALKAKNDPKAAEAAVNSVKKTVEASRKLVTPTANNFLAIERVAPGMARGEAPSWLTREAMAGTQISKEIAPKVADLNAAVEALVMDIRHGTFGASLTGTEKASFEQLITNSIKDGPEALARALNQLRQRAAQIAQDHFSFDMDFHSQETTRALQASNVWKQVLGEGGVYSDVWQLPEATAAAGTRPAAPTVGAGKTALWDVTNNKWVQAPDAQVEAAVVSGKYAR